MANNQNTVLGIPELIARLNRISDEGKRQSIAIISSVADLIVVDAKANAPADLGTIIQNIGKDVKTDGDKTYAVVFSAAPESPFMEFGTGGKVIIPTEMSDLAASFRGKSGGDFKAFVLALTGWVKRKGLVGVYSIKTKRRSNAKQFGGKAGNDAGDERAAYAIAVSILKNGLKPRPFLYPAYVKNIVKLRPMLETALATAILRGDR